MTKLRKSVTTAMRALHKHIVVSLIGALEWNFRDWALNKLYRSRVFQGENAATEDRHRRLS